MPAPKRRAGETQEEFNRRRVAYYANRRALNDAFYDDEEDVDIRDLTAGSPNSNGAVVSDMDIDGDEDWDNFVRSNAPKPSRLRNPANSNRFYAEDRRQSSRRPSGDRNIWEGVDGPSGYVYDDFTVDDSWVRGNADTAESASRNPAMRNGPQRVQERNNQNASAKMNPKGRAALTPGDYTRNIGRRNETGPSAEDLAPTPRRPMRVAEGGKGIPEKKRTENAYKDFRDYPNGKPQTREANEVSQRGSASQSSTSGNFRGISESGKTNTQIGQVRRFDEPIATNRNQASRTKEVRDGTIARMGSSRQVLEDGFNEEKKKSQFKGRHN